MTTIMQQPRTNKVSKRMKFLLECEDIIQYALKKGVSTTEYSYEILELGSKYGMTEDEIALLESRLKEISDDWNFYSMQEESYLSYTVIRENDTYIVLEKTIEDEEVSTTTYKIRHLKEKPMTTTDQTIKNRVQQLKKWNEEIKGIDDGEAYYGHWILIVPDEATQEDFEEIAEDLESYEEVKRLHTKLVKLFQ